MSLLSIVIPTLNEAGVIDSTLNALQPYRGQDVELIVADGGSQDGTVEIAAPLVDSLCKSPAGRALQMNTGADLTAGEWLLFLHADTQLPDDFLSQIRSIANTSALWGFFQVQLSGDHKLLRCVEKGMNWRSRLTSVATGDQAIFVHHSLWQELGGYAGLELMEDVDFSKRARKFFAPQIIQSPVVTSSRRWESNGIIKTIIQMWWLRLQYWFGVPDESLVRQYRS